MASRRRAWAWAVLFWVLASVSALWRPLDYALTCVVAGTVAVLLLFGLSQLARG